MIIISIVFICLTLVSAHIVYSPVNSKIYDSALSIVNTNPVRGLLAISILLCHLRKHVITPISFFSYMGSIGVGSFFFLSGYALTVSAWDKPYYFEGFLRKRLVKLGIPYLLFLVIYVIITCAFCKNTLQNITVQFLKGNPASNSWYIWIILLLYVVFYFLYKNAPITDGKPAKWQNVIIFVFLLLYIGVCRYVIHLYDWWYKTVLLFFVGCLYAQYANVVKAFLYKFYLPAFLVIAVGLSASFVFPAICNRMRISEYIDVWFVQDTLVGFFGTLFIILLCFKIKWSNPIASFLGMISLEIYLVHGMMIELFSSIIGNTISEFGTLLLTVCVIACAFIFHKSTERIVSYFK